LENNKEKQIIMTQRTAQNQHTATYEGWNFNSGNYLFTTDTK